MRACSFFLLILMSVCLACTEQNSSLKRIDITAAQPIRFEELIKDIDYIPLKGYYRSAGNAPQKIVISDSSIFFYSFGSNDIWTYSRSDEWMKKVDNRGLAAITFPTDIGYNKQEQYFYVLHQFSMMNKYKENGNFQTRVSLASPMVKISPFGHERFIAYGGQSNKKSDFFMSLLSADFQPEVEFARKPQLKKMLGDTPSLFALDEASGKVYYHLRMNDTIFFADPTNGKVHEPLFQLDFKGDFYTYKHYPKEGLGDADWAQLLTENQYVFGLNSFSYTSNKLLFQTEGKYERYFMVDLATDQVYSWEYFFDGIKFTHGNAILGTMGESLITAIETKKLIAHYARYKNDSPFFKDAHLLQALEEDGYDWIVFLIHVKPNIPK